MINNMDKYRNREGYIELKNIPNLKFLDRNTYGSRKKQWLKIGDTNYLFKENMRCNEDIKEVMNEEISTVLGIDKVQYDFAILNDKQGLITKDCLKQNDIFVPTKCLLFSDYTNKNSNDILTIYSALLKNNILEDEMIIILSPYIQGHIQDIFTSQYDRNYENTALINRNGKLLPFPRYDSANSFSNICDIQKMMNFMSSPYKESLFEKYKGLKTKQSISCSTKSMNTLEELVYYIKNNFEELPPSIKECFCINLHLIDKIAVINLLEIFKIIEDYYKFDQRMKKFFEFIIDYNIERYEKEKQKIMI